MRWSSQKHRNAGQERRRLLGGGDGEESSKSQSQNQELARKLEEQKEWRKAADEHWKKIEPEIESIKAHADIIKSDTSFRWDLGQTETGIYDQGSKND